MIKFEADPVVGQRQREACSDGERNTPRINTVAPKSPQRRVLSCFSFALLTVFERSSRRSDETQFDSAHPSKSVPSLELVTHATCSLSSPFLPSFHALSPFTVSLPRPSARLHFPHMLIQQRSNQFHFSPTLLAGPDLANCIHRLSHSPSGRHRK